MFKRKMFKRKKREVDVLSALLSEVIRLRVCVDKLQESVNASMEQAEEAKKLEEAWQEGLANILNYDYSKRDRGI